MGVIHLSAVLFSGSPDAQRSPSCTCREVGSPWRFGWDWLPPSLSSDHIVGTPPSPIWPPTAVWFLPRVSRVLLDLCPRVCFQELCPDPPQSRQFIPPGPSLVSKVWSPNLSVGQVDEQEKCIKATHRAKGDQWGCFGTLELEVTMFLK